MQAAGAKVREALHMEQIGAAALPVIVGVILLFGFFRDVDVFDAFVSGAKEGIKTTIGLLPTLIGLIVAVNMVKASGLLEALCALCGPLVQGLGVSPEVLPLALLRPGVVGLHPVSAGAVRAGQRDRQDSLGAGLLNRDHLLCGDRVLWGGGMQKAQVYAARGPCRGLYGGGIVGGYG